mgnify:CR=1 FL=1
MKIWVLSDFVQRWFFLQKPNQKQYACICLFLYTDFDENSHKYIAFFDFLDKNMFSKNGHNVPFLQSDFLD